MADVTAKRDDARQEGVLIDVKLASSTKLYAGTMVSANSSGLAVKSGDNSGDAFLGIAMETVDSANKPYIRVWREGVVDLDCTSATQAWVGQKVYAVDNHTVALAATTTNDVLVGTVVGYNSATSVRVKI